MLLYDVLTRVFWLCYYS